MRPNLVKWVLPKQRMFFNCWQKRKSRVKAQGGLMWKKFSVPGLKVEEALWQGMWVASSRWEWPPVEGHQENEDLSPTTTRKSILPTVGKLGRRTQHQRRPKSWRTPWFHPWGALSRESSCTVPGCLTWRSCEMIVLCCFKLCNLWSFVKATTQN